MDTGPCSTRRSSPSAIVVTPRCALEVYDSGQVRIDKIFRLIEDCRFGLHDISRTEFDPGSNLPRFNMPLELGIFLGAQRLGASVHRRKNCLIFDRERYRFQQFISDIAGQDIAAHQNDPKSLISTVRNWLSTVSGREPLPGGAAIAQRFAAFEGDLSSICAKLSLQVEEVTFANYVNMVRTLLTEQAAYPPPSRESQAPRRQARGSADYEVACIRFKGLRPCM